MQRILQRLRSQSGAALVEYALIASLIAIPSVAAMNAISTTMNDEFNAIEDNAASAGHGTTTTAAPTTTTAGGGGGPTTTAAPTTTSTTTSTTTTTTTTTTTAAPATTTTSPPEAPEFQTETAYTEGGWLRFELENGEVNLAGYDLYWGWRGTLWRNEDGSLTIRLYEAYGYDEIWIQAYVDEYGYLQVDVN